MSGQVEPKQSSSSELESVMEGNSSEDGDMGRKGPIRGEAGLKHELLVPCDGRVPPLFPGPRSLLAQVSGHTLAAHADFQAVRMRS